jgi:hypothetical protein
MFFLVFDESGGATLQNTPSDAPERWKTYGKQGKRILIFEGYGLKPVR